MRNNKKSLYLLFIFIAIFLWTNTPGQDNQIVRAYFTSKEMAHNALFQFEVEALEIFYDEGYIVLDVTPDDIEKLINLNYKIIPDPDYDVHHNRSSIKSRDGIPGYPSYQLVEETFEYAQAICDSAPEFATWIDAGDSWEKLEGPEEGYDIMVLCLTNSKIEGPKPEMFITGSIHAREYSTSELNRRFTKYLVDNYGKDPDVTWMLDYHEFHAMFFANPDGRKHAEGGDLWRKNTNTAYCTSNPSKRGCDLNRNFDYSWSSSNDQCGQTFSGSSGASEPETQAVQNYLHKLFDDDPKQGIYFDLHSYGEVILNSSTDEMETLAKKFSYFNGYDSYTKPGMTISYGYSVVGVASFLFELGTGFFQNCDYFEGNIVPKNIPAFKFALSACRNPRELVFGPEVLDVSIEDKVLTAKIDDKRFPSGVESQNITSAEYYIAKPPWVDGATPIPMEASDGSFDSPVEEVKATVNLKDLKNEQNIIFVHGKDADNNWGPVSAVFCDLVGNTISVQEHKKLTMEFNFPNSISTPVSLRLILPQATHIQFKIYNLNGKVIATLADNKMEAGSHSISWDYKDNTGNELSTGIYLYRLQGDNFKQSDRFIFLK